MDSLNIHAFTYEQRHGLLPELASAMISCGGWILERRSLSANSIEFRVEIQLRDILDLYASSLATGLEFTRSGHDTLTELCTRHKHLQADLGQVVAIRLEVAFLDDLTLYSLMAGTGVA